MPAQALYLKYRPQKFEDVEGQEHVTRTLKNAIALGRVAHGYLLAGPRGTGKTTTARLLAKAINCLAKESDRPCNACSVCQAINEDRLLDLIEIDAATHTGADHMRELREKADFRPTQAGFKVYIIDEVHMLSTAAFNALLKILEEPPPHIVFILATTDPQKIPATVLSRVQRFDFRRLTIPEIIDRLNKIAQKENLKVEPAVLELIARQATGAMRDAESLLDQLRAFGDEITLEQARGLLGTGSREAVGELVSRLAEKDAAGGLTLIGQVVDGGVDPRQLAREIVDYMRGLMLIQAGSEGALTLTADALAEMSRAAGKFTPEQLLRAIRLFNQASFELRTSANPTLPLELALVESAMDESRASTPAPAAVPTVISAVPRPSAARESRAPIRPTTKRAAEKAGGESVGEVPAPADPSGAPLSVESLRTNWSGLLMRVRPYDRVVEAVLRDAEPIQIEADQVTLGFSHEVHAERFNKQANGKAIIEKAIDEVFHRKVRVKCVLSPKKARLKAVEEDPLIRTAVNEWGAQITEIHDQELSK